MWYNHQMQRKEPLEVDETYHLMNKSIAGYKIFNSDDDYQRMLRAIVYFSIADQLPKFSYFLKRSGRDSTTFEACLNQYFPKPKRLVQIIAYCLMPTHLHIVLKPLRKDGATKVIGNVLNSYARYFNTKHNRLGPLWAGRFKNIMVKSDEQLWHLTRYVHLNPVSAQIVKKAEDWPYSSYFEYITPSKVKRPLCQYRDFIDVRPRSYQKFVEDQADYQRKLAQIKDLILE